MCFSFKSLLFSFGITMLLVSCAQVVAPSGGAKDITPPELKSLTPDNNSLNFNSKTIKLEFNEFIKLSNFKEQLIVSPPLKHMLETKVKGKTLILEINDTLKEETTYVFNFGNSIVDITENNPYENFVYAFSTTNYIDTLSLSGTLLGAFDKKPRKGVFAMLYKNTKDSVPLIELPSYIGVSNDKGEFSITNIKAGDYKLFALEDKNKNFVYDLIEESIAFSDTLVSILDQSTSLTLNLFELADTNQYIKNKKTEGSSLSLEFNINVDSVEVRGLDSAIDIKYSFFNEKSASFLFNTSNYAKQKIIVGDFKNLNDTITIKLDSVRNDTINVSRKSNSLQNYFEPLTLKLSHPVESIDTSKFILLKDSSVRSILRIEKDSVNHSLIRVFTNWQQDSTYSLSILPNAIKGYYNRSNDTSKFKLKVNHGKDFGSLKVVVEGNKQEHLLLQLFKGNSIWKQYSLTGETNYLKNIPPANYNLKIVIDSNNNNKWDSGSYLENTQAEEVIILNDPVKIRANWEKEFIWKINK